MSEAIADAGSGKKLAAYGRIIEAIFSRHYKRGMREFEFSREELESTAAELYKNEQIDIAKPKNLGDVIYSFRHRRALPASILATQPADRGWLILGAGDARYRFRLNKLTHIIPTKGLAVTKIPDATPEIITKYALTDEQALLAKMRYNRLLDIFLGVATYSLQSHLRTKIPNYGQIEIDELYVGIDRRGAHYVIPVQAKGRRDKLGAIQTIQDVTFCKTEPYKRAGRLTKDFSGLQPVAVSAQLIGIGKSEEIALFQLDFDGDEVTIVSEKHYKLVPASDISDRELSSYSKQR